MKTLRALALLPFAIIATQAHATFCNNDDDCGCGQVCSYQGVGQTCVTAGTDPGWCSAGQPNNGGCLYDGQICCGVYCYPQWSADAGCLKESDGGLEGSNTSGVSCPTGGSTGGASSSSTSTSSESSSTGGSGSSSTIVASSSSSGGSKSSTSQVSSSSAEGGSSTGGSTGSSNSASGGGCSSATGGLSFGALLAVGLLARSRRRRS
jgi:hypothetical protein